MARRLERRAFITHTNNGVTALVSEETLFDTFKVYSHSGVFQSLHLACGGSNEKAHEVIAHSLQHMLTPIFTFVKPERFKKDPRCFTGDNVTFETLKEYIKSEGGEIREGTGNFVPFSNGNEIGQNSFEALKREFRFMTSQQQFRDTFGISYSELLIKRVKKSSQHINEA